jgi:uncharacterized protein
VRATIATPEADGLVLRMEKHFGHKVDVERRDGVVHVTTRFGRFELEPREGALAVRLHAADPDQLPQLQEVVASHLERFARTPIDIAWE